MTDTITFTPSFERYYTQVCQRLDNINASDRGVEYEYPPKDAVMPYFTRDETALKCAEDWIEFVLAHS